MSQLISDRLEEFFLREPPAPISRQGACAGRLTGRYWRGDLTAGVNYEQKLFLRFVPLRGGLLP